MNRSMAFLEALGESINRGSCVILGGLAGQEEILRYVLEPLQTGNPGYNGLGALYADRCGMPPPGRPQPPFTGGQCQNVYYKIESGQSYTYSNPSRPDGEQFQLYRFFGPISSVRFVITSPPDGTRLFITHRDGTFSTPVNSSSGAGSSEFYSYTEFPTSVTRDDGAPDTCGDPPSSAPPTLPPGGNVYNDNVTYVNNEGDTITIPVVLAFGYATVNLDGTVNIPVNANFTLNPEFNGNFNFNFNTGQTQPDVSPPNAPLPGSCDDPSGYGPDPGIPDPPTGLPDEPPFDPPVDDPLQRESTIIGCIVTTSAVDDKSTVIFQDDNPDIYAPALGYVNFKIRIGESSAWTQDYPVKNLRQLIKCDWDGGAIAVRGSPRYGSVFSITPVRRRRSINPTFPPDTFEV